MNASNAPIKKSKAMKRIGNLYEQIISVENLRLADEKARRGKTSAYGVRCHDKNREANIQALHEARLGEAQQQQELIRTQIHPKYYESVL